MSKSEQQPAFKPFDDHAIYRVNAETAELMALTFRQLQRAVYVGDLSYIQYPSGRRLRGIDLNEWVAKRVTRSPAEHVPDPMAVARGQKSQRVQKARREAKVARAAKATRAAKGGR